MQDLPWEAAFDGAICMGNSLGGLDDAGIAAFFRAVARTLKPASRLVVNTGFVAESLLPHLKERDWGPLGDILYLAHRRYDPVQGRLNMDYTFIRGSQVEKKSAFGQVYTYKEFCRTDRGGRLPRHRRIRLRRAGAVSTGVAGFVSGGDEEGKLTTPVEEDDQNSPAEDAAQ